MTLEEEFWYCKETKDKRHLRLRDLSTAVANEIPKVSLGDEPLKCQVWIYGLLCLCHGHAIHDTQGCSGLVYRQLGILGISLDTTEQ